MFDFFKRKPAAASDLRVRVDRDPELERLRSALAAKQNRAAELEADLIESRDSLAALQREFEARLGPYLRRVAELQAQLQASRRATLRQMWEAQSFAPKYVDVDEQFRTAWTQTDTGTLPPPPPPTSAEADSQLKALYRELAKRYHPDLAATDEERQWRTPRMAEVNAAYAARDLAALQKLAAARDERPAPTLDSREAALAWLQHENRRLDELIERLESEFDALTNSPALQMQLEVSMARRGGRDLFGEAIGDLQREIEQLESELSNYPKP